MGERKQKNSDTKLINGIGLILILIVILRFGRVIILDIGLIAPNRLHTQYLQEVDRMSRDIFKGDPMLRRYEYEIRPYTFSDISSDKELRVSYSDKIELFLYLDDTFDDMSSEEQYEYIVSRQKEYGRRLGEINRTHPYRELLGEPYIDTHYKYKPNTCWEISTKINVSTDHYSYTTTSNQKVEKLSRTQRRRGG